MSKDNEALANSRPKQKATSSDSIGDIKATRAIAAFGTIDPDAILGMLNQENQESQVTSPESLLPEELSTPTAQPSPSSFMDNLFNENSDGSVSDDLFKGIFPEELSSSDLPIANASKSNNALNPPQNQSNVVNPQLVPPPASHTPNPAYTQDLRSFGGLDLAAPESLLPVDDSFGGTSNNFNSLDASDDLFSTIGSSESLQSTGREEAPTTTFGMPDGLSNKPQPSAFAVIPGETPDQFTLQEVDDDEDEKTAVASPQHILNQESESQNYLDQTSFDSPLPSISSPELGGVPGAELLDLVPAENLSAPPSERVDAPFDPDRTVVELNSSIDQDKLRALREDPEAMRAIFGEEDDEEVQPHPDDRTVVSTRPKAPPGHAELNQTLPHSLGSSNIPERSSTGVKISRIQFPGEADPFLLTAEEPSTLPAHLKSTTLDPTPSRPSAIPKELTDISVASVKPATGTHTLTGLEAEEDPLVPDSVEPNKIVSPMANTSAKALAQTITTSRTTVLPAIEMTHAGPEVIISPKDRYQPIGQLGEGGIGTVTLIQDNDIRRQVARKQLKTEHENPGNLRRFVEEIQTHGQLEHPNIAPLYDVGQEEDGTYYFIMKYIKGETLEEIIEKLAAGDPAYHKKWSFEYRTRVFIEILNALEFAHSRGVLHRDLKPANIMIGEFGEVMVMDWGLAKQTAAGTGEMSDNPYQTQSNTLLGTPAYMAPEQALGQVDRIDARSDLYSLSAIVYELFTLEHYLAGKQTLQQMLFGAIHEREIFASHKKNRHQPPVPPAISWLIHQGLDKEASKRFQSATLMKQEFQKIVEGKHAIHCPASMMSRMGAESVKVVKAKPFTMMVMTGFAAILMILGGLQVAFFVWEWIASLT